ncbi:FISUMP domain-containing protein [Dysgonomonas sp. 25]|uniref:FISUMP domain-containing protein n=1 Tax=Dysgonomonas sp. 25 TaxID=2302933 RepID=UPI0013CF763D|nr:FISUMP domain-containing protein [Dysgonomonas sp. 25]NDV68968.1 hypothetical protein [Dysgonomonas sp. 25]
MKKTLTQAMLILLAFTFATTLTGQVTIGSDQTPNPGALLDLKMNGTTTKGMKLPIVSLTDPDNLYPMFTAGSSEYTGTNKAAEDVLHTGLTVYNTTACDGQFAKGLYVWTGSGWEQVTDNEVLSAAELYMVDTLHIPSGMDARTSAAQTLNFTWDRGTHAAWSSLTSSIGGGLQFTQAYTHITPTSWTTSPSALSVYPDDMTSALVTIYNPWRTRESKVTFAIYSEECPPVTKELVLNQTNYALWVNGSATPTWIPYLSGTIPVRGNATWQASIVSVSGATITPTLGGSNNTLGGNATDNLTFTPTANTKYSYSYITIADTEITKRFGDITVPVLNCTDEPDMEGWAIRAGFAVADINSIPATGGTYNDGVNPITKANGIQLHKDQDGNIFLSGDFGTAGRWMLNNLAAISFAFPGRTGDDKQVNIPLPTYPSRPANIHAATPMWIYPSPDNFDNATVYNNNPRLGLLYNWAAATNSRGYYDVDGNLLHYSGQANITDGENAATPNIDPQVDKIQGICPNGWHLPSDWEWTQLEIEMDTNTSQYSSLADANASITIAATGYRGSTHGYAMYDLCPAPLHTYYISNAASNIISSTLRPGMNVIYKNGYMQGDFLMTASGEGYSAWYRQISNTGGIQRSDWTRPNSGSVRCKKD